MLRLHVVRFVAACGVALCATAASSLQPEAGGSADDQTIPFRPSVVSRETITRTLAASGGLLFIAGAATVWARRTRGREDTRSASTIRVEASERISPKATLFLVRVGDHEVLIAESESGVRRLESWSCTQDEDGR